MGEHCRCAQYPTPSHIARVTFSSRHRRDRDPYLPCLTHAAIIDAGFDTRQIVDALLVLDRGRALADHTVLLDQLRARLRDVPGVEAVTAASIVPLTGYNSRTMVYLADDSRDQGVQTYFVAVAPSYFETLRIPVRAGREFLEQDRDGAQRVAIVNETFAEQLWPGQSALGKRVSFEGPTGPWMEIVGVSAAIRYNSLGESPPIFLYQPYAQSDPRDMTLQFRVASGVPLNQLGQDIVQTVRSLDPSISPPEVQRLADDQKIVLLPAQLGAAFTGGLGVLALVLAAVGIFGVAAFDVGQRTRELGIRAALGATAAQSIRVVLRETVQTVAIGGGVGLALSLAFAQILRSALYGVGSFDTMTFVGTPVILIAVSLVGVFVPARRATYIDPAEALRANS